MKLEAAILCLWGPSSVSILSLRDVSNNFELQQKQTFNLTRNRLVLIAVSGVFIAFSFKEVFH